MPYCGQAELTEYLNFSTSPQAPVKAVACAFSQDAGAGMGLVMFSMFFFGGIGLAMSAKIRHPGPLVVAGMLTIGVAALSLPGQAAQVVAIVFLFAIAGLGIWLYSRAGSSL